MGVCVPVLTSVVLEEVGVFRSCSVQKPRRINDLRVMR